MSTTSYSRQRFVNAGLARIQKKILALKSGRMDFERGTWGRQVVALKRVSVDRECIGETDAMFRWGAL